jgi:TRAP-type uncharacterized transport system substrate-binding protein
MEEMIFNSEDAALQKLADITGKRIAVLDKAEPTVAADPLGEIDAKIEELGTQSDQLKDIREQVKGALDKVNEAI